jgi:hypothetical protein
MMEGIIMAIAMSSPATHIAIPTVVRTSRLKLVLSRLVFHLHLTVFLLFPAGFFIPSSVWPERIEFHFFYCVAPFFLFYAWGMIWTLKYRDKLYSICFLDTLMQWLRGHSIWDPKNYQHTFVSELFSLLGLNVSKTVPRVLLFLCIVVTATFYILKLNGIVLY